MEESPFIPIKGSKDHVSLSPEAKEDWFDPFKDLEDSSEGPSFQVVEEGNILPPEIDEEGCVEYKVKISKLTKPRFTSLVTQLRFRLREGMGKAIYYIGITDDGGVSGTSPSLLKTSLNILANMANKVGQCTLMPERFETAKGVYYKVTIIHSISY